MIAGESARYNLGPITREINVPTTALHFVHPAHRSNCRFDKEGEEEVDGERIWVVRFKERDRGGLISRGDGRNLPAEGRLWIVPADGRVVRSELVVKDFVRGRGDSRAEIHVTWRRDVPLDLWVPVEMREHYEGPWVGDVVDRGSANATTSTASRRTPTIGASRSTCGSGDGSGLGSGFGL